MITVLPEKDNNKVQILLKEVYGEIEDIQKGKDQAVLVAKESGKNLGYIVVDIISDYIRILDLKIDKNIDMKGLKKDELQIVDFIIKSACSYALNRNIFVIECPQKRLYNLMDKLGCKCIDGIRYLEIPKFISCACKG